MHAETVYLFRHAIMRDAAYQMQMPEERARQHARSIEVLEELFGGRPLAIELTGARRPILDDHPLDLFAEELAEHARLAQASVGKTPDLVDAERVYLCRSAVRAGQVFNPAHAYALWKQLTVCGRQDHAPAHLRACGVAAFQCGDAALAERHFQESVDSAKRLGDSPAEGFAHANLAVIYEQTGRLADAGKASHAANEILSKSPDVSVRAVHMGNMGNVLRRLERYEEAEVLFDSALERLRETGNRYSAAIVLGNLAILYEMTGRIGDAEKGYNEALRIHREVGNVQHEVFALTNLAGLWRAMDKLEDAEETLEEAHALAGRIGDRWSQAGILGNLAMVYQDNERFSQAEHATVGALGLHREMNNVAMEGLTLANLAGLYTSTGRLSEADAMFTVALQVLREVGDTATESTVLCRIGLLRILQGREEAAAEVWSQGAMMLAGTRNTVELEKQTKMMNAYCARAGIPSFEVPDQQGRHEPK